MRLIIWTKIVYHHVRMINTDKEQEGIAAIHGSGENGKLADRIRKCGYYLRLTSYELRFIDNVRVEQIFFES